MATIFSFFIIFVILLTGDCAPKYKNARGSLPQTVYDQKQEGGYNIQVHLKDFQIIALLGDDASSFGDYDYSYDYSDFTVKPISSSSSSSSSSHTPEEPITPSSTTPIPPTTVPPAISKNISSSAPATSSESPKKTSELVSTTPSTIIVKESTNTKTTVSKEPTSTSEATSSTNTSSTEKSTRLEEPGKIKVQIIEFPVDGSTVPGEDLHEKGETVPQGEIFQLRKCAPGFTRDKRGRCRRVRKPGSTAPQLFGFSQLASNLASRLQTRVSTENSASIEASED